MDIRTLRYFLAVAREENITKAAEHLHISQPSLSKQLMDLEQELGKTLLIRGKRKTTLTEDGVILRKRADEIVNLFEKTKREIGTDAGAISGEIAIGGNPTVTILKAAAALRKSYPDIQFHFHSGDATDVMERLDHGSLDFAVLLTPVNTLNYDYILLPDRSQWGLLMNADSPLAEKSAIFKQDLRTIPLILHQRVGLQHEIAHWAETDIEQLQIAATYNVVQGDPATFVRYGLGYFLTTTDMLTSQLSQDVCFRPLYPPLRIQCALVWKRYAVFSKAAERFLKQLRTMLS